MFTKLSEFFNRRHELAPQDQNMIEGLQLEAQSIQAISEMKHTGGWTILGSKLRQEAANEIHKSVKDNTKIQLILSILSTVETKEASKLLEDEINKIIPS